MQSMQKALIAVGIILLILGVGWQLFSKIGLGRLPGDVLIRNENLTFYFPLTSSIIISIIITIILLIYRSIQG